MNAEWPRKLSQTAAPALAPTAIMALAQAVTGGSHGSPGQRYGVYRTGPELEAFLGNCGIDFHLDNRSRLPAVRKALTWANRQRNALELLKRVIEACVDPAAYVYDKGDLDGTVVYLNEHLATNDLQLREVDGRYRLMPRAAHAVVAGALQEQARILDYDSVRRDAERALGQADKDPEDAITAACSMLESVCYCILKEMGQPPPAKKDVSHLVNTVQKHLNLSPERTDIEPEIKQILGGLSNVANGVGTLRTHAGDAHGRSKGTGRADGRIARLAIHAASTISLFFIETWRERQGDASHGDGK